jgi:hypothetical protein
VFLYFAGMGKIGRVFLWILLSMNCLVLLGQVWPQGAPPFAGTVSLAFHVLTFILLVSLLFGRKGRDKTPLGNFGLNPKFTKKTFHEFNAGF